MSKIKRLAAMEAEEIESQDDRYMEIEELMQSSPDGFENNGESGNCSKSLSEVSHPQPGFEVRHEAPTGDRVKRDPEGRTCGEPTLQPGTAGTRTKA